MLRRQARRWGDDHLQELGDCEVPALDFLDERAEEVWQPLIAIGLVVGGGWYERLIEAAKQLSGARTSASMGVELLADIRTVFHARGVDRLGSADLTTGLNALEGHRWGDWNNGKGFTQNALARQLRGFGVSPKKIRLDGKTTLQGYERDQFDEVFSRYLPSEPEHPEQSSNDATISGWPNWNERDGVPVAEMPENPHGASLVPDVPVADPGGPRNLLDESPAELWDGPAPDEGPTENETDLEQPDAQPGAGEPRLEVTVLGPDRYEVTGGAEPHVVELGTGSGVRCDCADFAFRGRVRDCKHVVAVRRSQTRADEDSAAQRDDDEHVVAPVGEPPTDGGVDREDDDELPF